MSNRHTLGAGIVIPPIYARLLCAHLNGLGFDNATICRDLALNSAALSSQAQGIAWPQFALLLDRLLTLTDQPWAGLTLGNANAASSHGPLGYAVLSAPDVRTVVEVLARYTASRFPVVDVVQRAAANRGCQLTIQPQIGLGHLASLIYDSCLATLFRLLDTVTAGPCARIAVYMPGSRPAWADEIYPRLLGVDVVFGAANCHVVIPASMLDQPCLTADAEAFTLACRHCEAQRSAHHAQQRVSEQVYQRLSRNESDWPALAALAEEMHMSRRTLIRRLRVEGTHYRALLDEARQAQARWYLEQTNWPVARIAERLGYQDASNFTRSFQRWFAMTPRAMRQRASRAVRNGNRP